MLCLSDERLEHLSQHLSSSIDNIVTNLPQVPKRRTKQVVDEITFQLKTLIDISLNSERERYIEEITAELKQVTKQRDKIYNELKEYKEKMKRNNNLLCDENIAYIQKTTALERELRSEKWHKIQKNTYLKDVILEKESNLNKIKKMISNVQQNNHSVTEEINSIRKQIKKNTTGMCKMMERAKYLINEQYRKEIISQQNKLKEKEKKKKEILFNKIKEYEQENEQLKHTISMIIDTVLSIAPESVTKPNINQENIVDNIPAFRNFLINCADAQKNEVITEVKRNVKIAIPNIDFKHGTDEIDVINSFVEYVQAKDENEIQHEEEIKKMKEQIEVMKKKLQQALGDLDNSRSNKTSFKKYLNIVRSNDTPIKDADEWEASRKQLDDTILKLSKYATPPTKNHIKE